MNIYKTKQDAAIVAIAAGCTEDVSRYYRDRHTRCKCGETEIAVFASADNPSQEFWCGICEFCGEEAE